MLYRMLLISGLILLGGAAWGDEATQLREHLSKYVGEWRGVFSLKAPDVDFQESFRVEQLYWWDGDVLRGSSTEARESGASESSSVTVIDGRKYVTEIRRADTVERYYGVLRDGGVVWFSTDLNRAEDYQIKEVIADSNGERMLITTGFDTFMHENAPSHLLYYGELVRQRQ